jgi:hypothetical protein
VSPQNCSIVHRGFSVTTIFVGKTAPWIRVLRRLICSRCASNGSCRHAVGIDRAAQLLEVEHGAGAQLQSRTKRAEGVDREFGVAAEVRAVATRAPDVGRSSVACERPKVSGSRSCWRRRRGNKRTEAVAHFKKPARQPVPIGKSKALGRRARCWARSPRGQLRFCISIQHEGWSEGAETTDPYFLADPEMRYSHKVYYGIFLYINIPDT